MPPSDVKTLPSGAMVALATPFADAELDERGLDVLVDRVVAGGVTGVCPAGSTGEGARLTVEQRLRLSERVREQVPARVAVLPAVPVTSVAATAAELDRLGGVGVTAALVAAPPYYPLADDEAYDFYAGLAAASPVPIVVYNIPVYTKVSVPPEVVGRLAELPGIVGIKDSSRDMEYLSGVLSATRDAPDFCVLTGTDTLLVASLLLGADGTIAAGANVVPELSAAICAAVGAGELDSARELQRRLTSVVEACRRGPAPAGWKAALAELGVCGPDCLPPARPLAAALRADLRADLQAAGVLRPE